MGTVLRGGGKYRYRKILRLCLLNKRKNRVILFGESKFGYKAPFGAGRREGGSVRSRDTMKIKLDETNLAIIKALRNGRASFRDIAADLGLSEVTVRTRAARLIEDGVLDICGQVDVEKLPGHTLALVAIKLRSPNLVGEGEVFSHLRGVVSVAVLTGRHDLILTVLLNEEFGLLDFYTNEFSKCHDRVSSIETFIVYKGFNLKVPYIL